MRFKQILILILAFNTLAVYAVDVAKLPVRHEKTKAYQKAIIEEALIQSQDKYGAYKFTSHLADLSSKRSFKELNNADQNSINIRVGLTSKTREENAIAIRLPLRKGLQSYKLLIINKKNLSLFDNTKTVEQLKAFSFGVVYDWVTAKIMHRNAFNVTDVPSYDGLFRMLSAERFNYTVLGLNEAFPILASQEELHPDLTVAPGIALFIQTPTYIFVSNNKPRLAERITWGLEKMIKNGRFDEIFYQFHQPFIDKANLKARTIISIPNPLLDELAVAPAYKRPELWFDPLK